MKMPLQQRRVTLYESAVKPQALDYYPLNDVLMSIKEGKYRPAVERIRQEGDKVRRQKLKKKVVPAVSFSGTFPRRANDQLREHSGLLRLDYDGLDDKQATRQKLQQDPRVLAVFDSVSGPLSNGLSVLVHFDPIPRNDAEHKIAFEAARRLFGLPEFDEIVKGVSWLTYMSYDPELYVNYEAAPIPVNYAAATLVQAQRKGHAELNGVIPDGEKYKTLRDIGAVLRGVGLSGGMIATALHALHETHGETVGEREPVDKLAEWLGKQDYDPTCSLSTFRAGVIKGLPSSDEVAALKAVTAGVGDAMAQSAVHDDLGPPPWVPFPTEALPAEAMRYVRAAGAALGCEEAMIAVPVLPVLAAAVGNTYRVQLKKSWTEPPTLWVVVISPSGSMKSPAKDKAVAPVYTREMRAKEDFDRRMADYKQNQELSKDESLNLERPRHVRYRLSDTTLESAAVTHGENPRGLLLSRDEAAGWFGSFDRYARGEADMQGWIEMYEGRLLQVDRKTGDPKTIFVKHPAVCFVGTIQPQTLNDRLTRKHFEAGFAARLLLTQPPERPKQWTDADIEDSVRAGYVQLVNRLYDIEMLEEPRVLGLDPDARQAFQAFYNENAALIGGLSNGPIRSALSKIEAVAARLALTLHVAACLSRGQIPGYVSADAMHRALVVVRWLRYEALRVYHLHGFHERHQSDDERHLAGLPEEFTHQDVQGAWSVKKRAAHDVIQRLLDRGLAEKVSHGVYHRGSENALHFLHFLHDEAAKVQKVQCSLASSPIKPVFDNLIDFDDDEAPF